MNANRQAATTDSTAAIVASTRKFAIAAGVCYLITHVTSVSAPAFYGAILNNSAYLTGSGSGAGVLVGALFDVICAMANIGTAVALYPVVKKHNEGIALGYVGLRTLEAGIIAVGTIPLLAAVTLRQMVITADPSSLLALGSSLVESYKWTAVLGPGLVCGVNTVLMAYLLYRSRLVPRFIPILGLVGGPLVFAYNTALMFGFSEQIAAWAVILVIPIFAWEVSLALRLIVKGFNPVPMDARSARTQASELFSPA
jgi:hypothetical protein